MLKFKSLHSVGEENEFRKAAYQGDKSKFELLLKGNKIWSQQTLNEVLYLALYHGNYSLADSFKNNLSKENAKPAVKYTVEELMKAKEEKRRERDALDLALSTELDDSSSDNVRESDRASAAMGKTPSFIFKDTVQEKRARIKREIDTINDGLSKLVEVFPNQVKEKKPTTLPTCS